jgi:hypothetical protein
MHVDGIFCVLAKALDSVNHELLLPTIGGGDSMSDSKLVQIIPNR